MTNFKKTDWVGCPIRYASGIFGDKWSLMIIRDLMFKGRRYYGEFLAAGEGVSTNILADRLGKLEESGIISKQRDPVKGSKVIYTLTDKGLALMPTMLAMMEWSEKYDAKTEVPEDCAKLLRHDRSGLQRDLEESIKRKDKSLFQ